MVGDLKEQAGEDVVRRRWKFLPRNPLVVIQIAFSLALLTAAALFIRGAGKAASVDTGLETTNQNFLLELDASLAGYDQARSQNLYRTLEERLAALPGVERASISSTVPFGMVSLSKAIQRGGANPGARFQTGHRRGWPAFGAHWNSVGADYFSTVGLRLAARPRFQRRGSDASGQSARRHHRRSAGEKTLAGGRRARAANPICRR